MFNGSVFHFNVAVFYLFILVLELKEILRCESKLCSHEPLFENFSLRLRFHRFSMARDLDTEISFYLFLFLALCFANILGGRILCNQNIRESLPPLIPFLLSDTLACHQTTGNPLRPTATKIDGFRAYSRLSDLFIFLPNSFN